VSKSRVEAFSDGVFAIAITLLVLEIRVPNLLQATTTAEAAKLLAQWPQYVAYAMSFLIIGVIWMNHHALFSHLRRIDRAIVILNLLILMAVSFIPFPTAILANYPTLPPSIVLYGGTLLLVVVLANVLWFTVLRHDYLNRATLSERAIRHTSIRFVLGIVAYALATSIGYFFPRVGIALFLAIVVFYYLPGGLDSDLKGPGPASSDR